MKQINWNDLEIQIKISIGAFESTFSPTFVTIVLARMDVKCFLRLCVYSVYSKLSDFTMMA